ncbi:MAG: T9SS type A sorting domain-containing protein, partial [Bacteroidota bacterium]
SAPAGLYTVAISAGPNTGTAVATDEVTVIVPASRAVAGGSAEWTLVDAQPWPALEAAARTSALGAFPNPFADRTEIGFELEASARVELVVYDVRGREVATLANDVLEAGQHSVEFDAASLPSGVYIYRLVTGTQVETGRMTLVK